MSTPAVIPKKVRDSDEWKKLTPQQRKAIDLIVNRNYEPCGKALAKEVGIKINTLRSWWRDDIRGYKEIIRKSSHNRLEMRRSRVYNKLGVEAEDGSIQHQRLFTEILGDLPKATTTHPTVINVFHGVPKPDAETGVEVVENTDTMAEVEGQNTEQSDNDTVKDKENTA